MKAAGDAANAVPADSDTTTASDFATFLIRVFIINSPKKIRWEKELARYRGGGGSGPITALGMARTIAARCAVCSERKCDKSSAAGNDDMVQP